MSSDNEQIFDRLGGSEGISAIVNDMYDRIFADEELAPFFRDVDKNHLRRMQTQFMASALDGPVEYSGADLTKIHAGRGITGHHFARFCGHFADAMEAAGAPKADVDAALGRLATYKDQVTGDTTVDG